MGVEIQQVPGDAPNSNHCSPAAGYRLGQLEYPSLSTQASAELAAERSLCSVSVSLAQLPLGPAAAQS